MAELKQACSAAQAAAADPAGAIREAVCIDTSRVYDSCADKDCLSDLRVMFTSSAQELVNEATSVRCRGSEILDAYIDVEEVPFNRGFYTVDITFFFRVTFDLFCQPVAQPTQVSGLCSFSKKCILYGSDGNVKVFSSNYRADESDEQLFRTTTNPRAKVQAVDPVCLDARLCDVCNCHVSCCCGNIPGRICKCFDGDFGSAQESRVILVTLGLFTIVQLERNVQMLIPAYDFCMPEKECSCDTDDPCDVFRKIEFPVDEFFPPRSSPGNGGGCCCDD